MKECCQTWGGMNGQPPDLQSEARARDKGSIRVKYPYVFSKYSIIFKNLGIDTQLIWQIPNYFQIQRLVSRPEKHMITIL